MNAPEYFLFTLAKYTFIYCFSTLILYKQKTELTVLTGFQLPFGPEVNF